ncbi:PD-(D/E)XK nuclease family protein [archaeon]
MPTWSHSRISTYESCPLKFFLTVSKQRTAFLGVYLAVVM